MLAAQIKANVSVGEEVTGDEGDASSVKIKEEDEENVAQDGPYLIVKEEEDEHEIQRDGMLLIKEEYDEGGVRQDNAHLVVKWEDDEGEERLKVKEEEEEQELQQQSSIQLHIIQEEAAAEQAGSDDADVHEELSDSGKHQKTRALDDEEEQKRKRRRMEVQESSSSNEKMIQTRLRPGQTPVRVAKTTTENDQNQFTGPSEMDPAVDSGKATSSRTHKAMPEAVWIARLKKFAQTGTWPEDNRPASRDESRASQVLSSPSAPLMPRLWAEELPAEDHALMVKALYKMGAKGKLKLWYHPPQPSNLYDQAPLLSHFFTRSLFVWMPYKLWKVKVVCPNASCGGHQLTEAGLHGRARQVMDVDRVYNMVTEMLMCSKCKVSHVSWSQVVLQQLDLGHRAEFRVIMTENYACDIRVIRLLRETVLGNNPTQVLKQLWENHTEEWLQRVASYTNKCVAFIQRPELLPVAFPEPPERPVVPSCKWLLSVYSQDILTRLEDIKASITSTYGNVLKMGSTRKITKKLAGTAKGTAHWLTSVGNEYGQILMSVLTAQEGAGLDQMAEDLVRRYAQAGVDPPVALYVDCGCCAAAETTKLQARFSGWPDLVVRLDICHFMRRIALACTTNAHQLYPAFMEQLSACIFEWDAEDLALLRQAKAQQLQVQGLSLEDVDRHLTREERDLHCRQRTRGEDTTIRLLEELFTTLRGPRGNDSLGVPLFDVERLDEIWQFQRKHVKCIQDPPGVALYYRTGELTKGGVRLPVLRCARGSTSLESFHLHLNRFIPGTSVNSLNFQLYLLEGLHRWNQDRRVAALATEPSGLCCYSGNLLHSVNQNYQQLFGRKLVPEFCPPSQYTGELIGVQYLFRQTGRALQDMNPDSEGTAQLIEEHDVVADEGEDEGFSDLTEDPTVIIHEASPAPDAYQVASSTSSFAVAPDTTSSMLTPKVEGLKDEDETVTHGTTSSMLTPKVEGLKDEDESVVAPSTSSFAVAPDTTSSMLTPTVEGLKDEDETVTHGTTSSMLTPTVEGSKDEDETLAVDDQNMRGYQHVDRLAEYLVGLRDQTSLCLTSLQANQIVELWENMDAADKQHVIYAARHQDRLLSEHLRTLKRLTKTRGMDRRTRRVLGASSDPAQWPDCCRLVENIFIRLCALHPAPYKKGKKATWRWALILKDYHKIRQLVISDARVMARTEMQIVGVNQTTLIQWYNKRQELPVWLQGTALPPVIPKVEEPLLEVAEPPVEPAPVQQDHQYHRREATEGQVLERQIPRPILPKGATKRQVMIVPGTATAAGKPVLVQYVLPVLTKPGAVKKKRPYRRTVQANTCKKCGKFRTAENGHSQSRGRVYCPNFEALTKEQWLEEMRKSK